MLPVAASMIKGEKDRPYLLIADINESTKKLVGEWAGDDAAIPVPKAIVASPLAAEMMAGQILPLEADLRARMPSIVVPFGKNPGEEGRRFHSVAYDYSAAYAAMGREAARLTKRASDRSGIEASCGILFQENFMRDRRALDAFIAAFSDVLGQESEKTRLSVDVLELEELRLDPAGATKAAIATLTGKKENVVIVLAIDDAAAAGAAAAAAKAAVKADGSADIVFMADASAWAGRKPAAGIFAYGIKGDEKALARATIGSFKDIAGGRKVDPSIRVPLRFSRFFPGIF